MGHNSRTMNKPDEDDLELYRSKCTRFIAGHGNLGAADLLATIPADVEVDRYGAGGAVEALEAEIRKVLGKPAAAFMPSGTLAQQRRFASTPIAATRARSPSIRPATSSSTRTGRTSGCTASPA
jgi:hypothetical protein